MELIMEKMQVDTRVGGGINRVAVVVIILVVVVVLLLMAIQLVEVDEEGQVL